MTDKTDVKAAAERLTDGRLKLEDLQGPTSDEADLRAAVIVARTYIAALPLIERAEQDNDQTPVTEGWLRGIGFYSDGLHLYLLGFGPDRNGTIQFYDKQPTIGWSLNGTRIFSRKTRGDVRTLCRVLGIKLKETVE